MKANKNYKLAGQRNFSLGQIAYAKGLLNSIFKSGKLIPSESVAVRSAIDSLNNIDKIKDRQRIFGQINGFKKYQNEKI